MVFYPKNYKIVSGVGRSRYSLVAFDNALRNAGIGDFNLVKVSSIIPPNCHGAGSIDIEKGSILFTAYSSVTVSDGNRGKVGVAVALPSSCEESGVIFECSAEENPAEALREMCEEAMQNRGKKEYDFQVCTAEVIGEEGYFLTAIAAVVLW
ncbi:MAG: pyruvoyl-dependent arginine decarboxylase, partial [Tannerella sp.]|jgi:arginine decarboxylase|nr:pyruvoyl-dependent arginine decarboxylase [Tannerella sp.]